MRLNSRVVDARWDEDSRQWHVAIQKTEDPETIFQDKADILINASGVLK